jgi:prophage regulatory protein
MRDVLERIPLSKATIYRLIAQGRFPTPLQISKQRIAFVEGDVDAWVASRIATKQHPSVTEAGEQNGYAR